MESQTKAMGTSWKQIESPHHFLYSNRSTYYKASMKVSWGSSLAYVTSLTILTVNTTRIWRKLLRVSFELQLTYFHILFLNFISRLLQQCEAFAKTLPELDPERLSSFYRHANPSVWYISLKATGDARYFFSMYARRNIFKFEGPKK